MTENRLEIILLLETILLFVVLAVGPYMQFAAFYALTISITALLSLTLVVWARILSINFS